MGAVATLLQMQHGFVHPTTNYEFPDAECDLDYVPNMGRPHEIRAAIVNSIGFGSKNSTLVFKQFADGEKMTGAQV